MRPPLWDYGNPKLKKEIESRARFSATSVSHVLMSEFAKVIERRRARGYWDVSDISPWGLERLMMTELKLLGVDKDTISIQKKDARRTVLNFDWGFLGQPKRRRTITYVQGYLDYIARDDLPEEVPSLDVFYTKSVETRTAGDDGDPLLLNTLAPLMSQSHAFILGHNSESPLYDSELVEQKTLEFLGNAYTQIRGIDSRFISDMTCGPIRMPHYGWRLYGFATQSKHVD